MATEKRLYVSDAERTHMITKIGYSSLFEGAVTSFKLLQHLSCEGKFSVSQMLIILAGFNKGLFDSTYNLQKVGELKILISLPRLKVSKHIFNGEHYWEIGKAEYPLSKIINEIQKAGFWVEKTYSRVFENPYHRFLILRKEK